MHYLTVYAEGYCMEIGSKYNCNLRWRCFESLILARLDVMCHCFSPKPDL